MPTRRPHRRRSQWLSLRPWLLLLGGVVLLSLLWGLGPAEAFAWVGRVGWSFGLMVLLYTAHHATRALAMHVCVLEPRGLRYRDALAIRLAGEAIQSLSFTGPLLAEPTRAWLLKRRGLTLTEGFAATIAEYLMSALAGAAMSIVALGCLLWRYEPSTIVVMMATAIILVFGTFVVAAALAIAGHLPPLSAMAAGLGRIGALRGPLRREKGRIARLEEVLRALFRDRPSRVTAIALTEVLAQIPLVLELYWLLRLFEVAGPAWTSFVVEGSTKVIIIAFPFIPLQVGVGEGAYALTFSAMGLPPVIGFSIAFLRRLRSLVIAGVGLAILAVLTRRHRGR
jgi:hypothetical protein